MSLIELLILLLVAGICGSIAQSLVGHSRGGCLVSIILGFIGALLGTYLARLSGLPDFLAISIGGKSFLLSEARRTGPVVRLRLSMRSGV